jgi:virginiamycin B lyase
MIRITSAVVVASLFALTSANAASVSFYKLPPHAYPHDVAPAVDGAVWYSGQRLGVLGRFDPKTEKFETFPSDKPRAQIRQMLGRPGEAWGGESGTDRLVVVRD